MVELRAALRTRFERLSNLSIAAILQMPTPEAEEREEEPPRSVKKKYGT